MLVCGNSQRQWRRRSPVIEIEPLTLWLRDQSNYFSVYAAWRNLQLFLPLRTDRSRIWK